MESAAPPSHPACRPRPHGGRGTNVLFMGSSHLPCRPGSWAHVAARILLDLALLGLRMQVNEHFLRNVNLTSCLWGSVPSTLLPRPFLPPHHTPSLSSWGSALTAQSPVSRCPPSPARASSQAWVLSGRGQGPLCGKRGSPGPRSPLEAGGPSSRALSAMPLPRPHPFSSV